MNDEPEHELVDWRTLNREQHGGATHGEDGEVLVSPGWATAEAIVRAVAAEEPMVRVSDDFYDTFYCGFCEAEGDVRGPYDWGDVTHKANCPYRRADEWVAAHPEDEREKP